MTSLRNCLLLTFVLTACRSDKSPFDEEERWEPTIEDMDGDGFASEEDCNDSDSVVYPGAEEICDGIDNDCDGETDEGVTSTYYADTDGDGFGNPDETDEACQLTEGWVTTGNDCDDNNPSIYPSAAERCDDLDNDCDGEIDEDVISQWYADADEDGYGDPDESLEECDPPSGYVADASDCDDSAPSAYPGATEICDELDNDCDGVVDEGVTTTWYSDTDSDSWGSNENTTEACTQPSGYVLFAGDCDDDNAAIHPAAPELCNDLDDNCDGAVDTDAVDRSTWYLDSDGDGYGDSATTAEDCEAPSGYVSRSDDCDDSTSAVHPDAAESCNGIDDDCDLLIDDSDPDVVGTSTWYIDYDSDGFGSDVMTQDACEAPSNYVADATDCDDTDASVSPDAEEECNGTDDDCDGDIDEDGFFTETWFEDADGDGFGNADSTQEGCEAPSGYTDDDTDCDDDDAAVNPEAEEECNGLDDDCSGSIDEGLLGLDADCAASDCLEIIDADSTVADGSYWLELDGTATEVECDMSTDGGGWTLIFSDDFDAGPDAGWSISDTTTCGAWGTILGGYGVIAGDEIDISLDVYDIDHTEAWIELDYLAIDSWDNEAMYMDVDGTNIWAEAQNNHSSVYGEVCGWDRGYYGSYDSLEPVSEFFSHSDTELELVVGSTLDQSAYDESFGIDNVWVWVR